MDQDIVISSASVSDRGLSEKRPENEDSYLEMPRTGVFAVADGVGGAQAGEVASSMAMEILGEAFANLPHSADAETVMRTAIDRANTAIFQMAHDLPQLATMATTIVALHLNGNIATIGHVGDSRLYRVDRDGELHRETDDHSMVAEEVRAGRMTEEQAENHPSRNIISRALGAEVTVEPDLKTIMVEPGTAFLLCSDGITRHVGDQEIRGVLTFGGPPEDVCEYLKDLCYQRGAEDNLTAVVIKLAGGRASASETPSAPQNFENDALEIEEMTVATARTALPDDDERDTAPLDLSDEERETAPFVLDDEPEHETKALDIDIEELFPSQSDPIVSNDTIEIITEEPRPAETGQRARELTSDEASSEKALGAGLGGVLTSLIMLVLGGAIGVGIYHYVFVRPQLERQVNTLPAITEMQSGNQPLAAFEENRRTVDLYPDRGLAQFGKAPNDAEDFYLVGRANLLLGQYVDAKKAFVESKAQIAAGKVDTNNKRTLETEIAIAMAVINDTTVQTILKSQLAGNTANSATPLR